MTSLSKRKTKLVVEFSDAIRERGQLREVTMELTPYGITLRLKGMRQKYEISPGAIYNLAVQRHVERERAARKAARRA